MTPATAFESPEPPRGERGLDDLGFGEQFFVWALRAWVHNSRCGPGDEVAIEAGFRLARVEPALATLSFFMRAVQRAARRPIEVRCVPCPALSGDEELLMLAAGALQAGEHATAHIVLNHYLPCVAVRPALWPLEAFAERLLGAQLLVRPTAAGRCHVEALALDMGLHAFALH